MADRTSAAQDFRADVSTRLQKPSVRVATTGALAAYTRTGNTIEADANGALGTIDGVADLAVGDRLLLKNGAAGADEGIYKIRQLGSGSLPYILDRSWDMQSSAQIRSGTAVFVSEGTANGGTRWYMAAADPIVLNTDDPEWTTFPDDDALTALLASTANGEGASLVSIEDAGTLITATDVEGALAEIAEDIDDLSLTTNGNGASLIGVEDADSLLTATDVEAALAEIRTPQVRAVAAGENVTLTPADHGRTVTFQSDGGGAATIAVGTLPAGGRVILQMSLFDTDAYTATVSGGTLTFNATGELAEIYYDGTDLIVLSLAGATVV